MLLEFIPRDALGALVGPGGSLQVRVYGAEESSLRDVDDVGNGTYRAELELVVLPQGEPNEDPDITESNVDLDSGTVVLRPGSVFNPGSISVVGAVDLPKPVVTGRVARDIRLPGEPVPRLVAELSATSAGRALGAIMNRVSGLDRGRLSEAERVFEGVYVSLTLRGVTLNYSLVHAMHGGGPLRTPVLVGGGEQS